MVSSQDGNRIGWLGVEDIGDTSPEPLRLDMAIKGHGFRIPLDRNIAWAYIYSVKQVNSRISPRPLRAKYCHRTDISIRHCLNASMPYSPLCSFLPASGYPLAPILRDLINTARNGMPRQARVIKISLPNDA